MLKQNKGFTLVEILIAMAIFAIISVLTTLGLKTTINQYQATKTSQTQLINSQRLMLKISQDIMQIVYGQKISNKGATIPNIEFDKNNSGLSFLTGGWQNFTRQNRSNLQWVHYHLVGEELVRSHWLTLHEKEAQQAQNRTWLKGVQSFSLIFKDKNNKSTKDLKKANHLAISLELKDLGELNYVVPLPSYQPIV